MSKETIPGGYQFARVLWRDGRKSLRWHVVAMWWSKLDARLPTAVPTRSQPHATSWRPQVVPDSGINLVSSESCTLQLNSHNLALCHLLNVIKTLNHIWLKCMILQLCEIYDCDCIRPESMLQKFIYRNWLTWRQYLFLIFSSLLLIYISSCVKCLWFLYHHKRLWFPDLTGWTLIQGSSPLSPLLSVVRHVASLKTCMGCLMFCCKLVSCWKLTQFKNLWRHK